MNEYIKQLLTILLLSLVLFILIYLFGINSFLINDTVKYYFLSAIIQSNCALFGLILVSLGLRRNEQESFFHQRVTFVSFSVMCFFICIIILLSIFFMLIKISPALIILIACMESVTIWLIFVNIINLIDSFSNKSKKEPPQIHASPIKL